jgi:hypothetical protein
MGAGAATLIAFAILYVPLAAYTSHVFILFKRSARSSGRELGVEKWFFALILVVCLIRFIEYFILAAFEVSGDSLSPLLLVFYVLYAIGFGIFTTSKTIIVYSWASVVIQVRLGSDSNASSRQARLVRLSFITYWVFLNGMALILSIFALTANSRISGLISAISIEAYLISFSFLAGFLFLLVGCSLSKQLASQSSLGRAVIRITRASLIYTASFWLRVLFVVTFILLENSPQLNLTLFKIGNVLADFFTETLPTAVVLSILKGTITDIEMPIAS